ncbi:hypothetical protein WJX74_007754 [Apatococcus lobatus]|uniref:Serine/threonine-protein kinase RIO1 n=1 Tax=Apatococcus lobatus TaxID=904363 RepID=A0AAW1S011_9CHLO
MSQDAAEQHTCQKEPFATRPVPRRRPTESGMMDAHGEVDMENMSSTVEASFRGHSRQQMTGAVRTKDRADRATSEQVLDPRTITALQVMRRAEVFDEMNGVLATGKEANVYHATTLDGGEVAIKIFKTSILVFKDRDRYVTGDFRFRTGYCKSNPRKMVKAWAEKERRNLARIHSCGIRSPKPLHLRMHLLAMEFIGSDGVPAPRLKDAKLSMERAHRAYWELVRIMRRMYQEAHLVHADLSEWNVLFHEDELYVIDVGQAVDLDHPHCLEFLREDALHVSSFFQKLGVPTLTIRQVFDYAVDPSIATEQQDSTLDKLLEQAASQPASAESGVASAEDEVFRQAYIPRRLGEVADHERDYDRLTGGGDTEGIYYQSIAGMNADMSGARSQAGQPSQSNSSSTSSGNAAQDAKSSHSTAAAASMQQSCHVEGDNYLSSSTGDDSDDDESELPTEAASSLQSAAATENDHREASGAAGKLAACSRHQHSNRDMQSAALDPAGGSVDDRSSNEDGANEASDVSSSTDYSSDAEVKAVPGEQPPGQDSSEHKDARKAHKAAVKADNRERRKTKVPKHIKKRAEKKHKRK